MQFGKTHFLDSILHTTSSSSSSSLTTQELLLDQLLELEKKKFSLQKQKGQIDVNILKQRIHQLEGEVQKLQPSSTNNLQPVTPNAVPPITPLTTQTPAFLHTVSSKKEGLTPPLPPSYSRNKPSSSTLPPHSSLKQEALAALLAEKENESFSDDDQEDNDEDISLTSANLDRRASRELTPPNLNRLSISRNNDLVDVFHPKPSHHPLSNRLNYNNLGRPPSVGATGRPPSTGYTPPRFNTNIRTISANDGDRGRESLGSVEERTSLSNFYPPLDEKLTRIDNSDFIQDKAVLAGVRAHLNTEDLETDYLETNDGIADLSPPNTLSACQNLLEFCIIEADWQELLKQSLSHALKDTTAPDLSQPHMLTRPKYLSNLIPPKLIWRYPSTVDEQTNNTSTVQDQNFFFPSGVKVELVSRSVMEIKTRYYNYKRHIIPFSDRQGLPLYACCLTVNQSYNLTDIAKINDDLPFYLYRISKAKTAVKVIQKSFRYYLKRKRIKQWQTIDIADIKKLQQERQFFMNINGSSNSESMNGTSSQIGPASRFSFTGGGGTHQGSQGTPRSSSHRGSATANSATAPSGGGFFSRIFRRQSGGGIEERASRDSLDESSHHHNSTLFGFNRQTNKSETGNWTSSSHGKLGVEPLSTPSKGSTASTSASTTTATSVNPPSTNAPQRTSSLSFFSRSLTGSVSKMGTVPPTEVKADSRSKSNESNSEVTLVTESADLETSKQSITSLPEAKTEEVKSSPVEEEEVKKEDITPEHVQEVQEEKKEEAVNHEQLLMDEYHKFLEDKVVIGQKAYCVISSSPEYTFIFLLLDAIHQAESDFFQQREIHRKNLEKNEGSNHNEEGEEKGGKAVTIINEDEHEILRGKFLNKTKNFIEKYLINKQFQIEDLSNHFTIPKNYYQYKMNYYPPLQSIEHQKRYEFYHQLMFPHRYIPTNNTTQQALEEEMNSNYFDSVVNSPKFSPKPSFNTPTASSSSLSRLGRRTFSSQLMKGEGSVSMIDLNKEQEEAGFEVVKSDRDDIIAGIVQESKDDSDGKSEEVSGKSTDDVQPDEGGSPKKKRPTSLTITDDTLTTSASSSPFRSSMLANGRKTSSRRLLAEFASPLKVPSSLGSPTTNYTQCLRVRGYGRPLKIDFRYLLSTKEWSCAVLLTHLNAQVIFKIINLLLMEKSLIIYGKNPGIVSAITLGVMNLISPFIWEGIFIPLVPDIARELFGAPVPLIIGTISPPRLSDISPATAILHLNDDCVQGKLVFSLSPNHHQNNPTTQSPGGGGSLVRGVKIPSMSQKRKSVNPSSTSTVSSPASTTNTATEMLKDHHVTVSIEEVDFLAWFTRLPEVSIDMPIQEELSKRITHLRKLLCQNLLPHIHYVYDILLYDPKTLFEEIDQSTLANKQKPSSDESYYLKTMEKTISIKNTIDHLILNNNHLPLKILEEITVLLIRIKNYNYQFIGEILQLTSYDFNRFLKKNDKTNQEEFYPNLFLEPIRNRLEFQEGIIHTQMFLSFLERIRKESMMLNQIREFIGHWIYQQHIRRKKRKNL